MGWANQAKIPKRIQRRFYSDRIGSVLLRFLTSLFLPPRPCFFSFPLWSDCLSVCLSICQIDALADCASVCLPFGSHDRGEEPLAGDDRDHTAGGCPRHSSSVVQSQSRRVLSRGTCSSRWLRLGLWRATRWWTWWAQRFCLRDFEWRGEHSTNMCMTEARLSFEETIKRVGYTVVL